MLLESQTASATGWSLKQKCWEIFEEEALPSLGSGGAKVRNAGAGIVSTRMQRMPLHVSHEGYKHWQMLLIREDLMSLIRLAKSCLDLIVTHYAPNRSPSTFQTIFCPSPIQNI